MNDRITRQLRWAYQPAYIKTEEKRPALPPVRPTYWDWRAVSRQMNRRK